MEEKVKNELETGLWACVRSPRACLQIWRFDAHSFALQPRSPAHTYHVKVSQTWK